MGTKPLTSLLGELIEMSEGQGPDVQYALTTTKTIVIHLDYTSVVHYTRATLVRSTSESSAA